MKRTALLLSLLVLCLVAIADTALAQTYLNATGNPSFGVNIPVENGFINVANGNLHMEFPLATHKQRGALALNERFVYDSRIWDIVHYSGYYWWPTNVPNTPYGQGGWRFVAGNETGTFGLAPSSGSNSSTCIEPPRTYLHFNAGWNVYNWTDPAGTVHTFDAIWDWDQTPQACSLDYTKPTNQTVTGYANDASGYFIKMTGLTSSRSPTISIVDSSGTQVYPQVIDRYGNYWSTDSNGNLIDDVGRTPVIATVNGNITYYDVLAPNGSINNNGTRVRYTVTTAPVQISTNFNQPSSGSVAEWTGTIDPVQSIQLPDGSSYTFSYDSYGEMTSVTLPTGGIVSYGWGNYLDSYQNENRWVYSRTVGNNQPTTFTPTVLTQCSSNGTGCQEQMRLHKPSGDETVYQLTLNNGAWNTNVTSYNGPASAGAAVLSTANTYDFSHACSSQICTGAEYITKSNTTTTLLDTGTNTQTQTLYNSQIGKPTAVKEWDYFTGSPSTTPTRETDYQYTATGFDTSLVTVYDESHNPAGQITYGYTSSAATTSGVTQHGTANAGGPYLQTVSHWLNTTGAQLATTYGMDDTGQVISTSDPNGNPPSTASYQCANSLPYQSTNALNQPSRYGYDCNSGAVLSVQDPNDLAAGRSGTTYSYDSAGRQQAINYPDGGQTSYGYPSAREVDTTVLATPSPSIVLQDIADEFGRKYQHIQSGVSAETSYDSSGRVSCATNPHIGSPSGTDGSTCIARYDGLDRPLLQTQPDGNTLSWSYSGNIVTSTNETGQKWQRYYDIFGRLARVVDPPQTITGYTYDALNNLRTVAQNGLSGEAARSRTFVYDSLSRLTSATNPETGTISYGYDPNGNVTSATDARNIAINYTYDPLNRVTWKTSSGGSGVLGFQYRYGYDGNDENGNPIPGVTNSIGQLTHPSNEVNAAAVYSYDPMGRVTGQSNCIPSDCISSDYHTNMSATYDLAGNLKSLRYPSGRTINEAWDGAGHLQSVVFDNWNGQHVGYSYASGFTYTPSGAMTEMTLGNGVYTHMPYNNRQQICQVWVANAQQALIDKHYFYTAGSGYCANNPGNNGNIAQIMDMQNNNRSQGFSYDGLNRLASFSNGDGSMQQSYSFDSFGNMNQSGTANSGLSFAANNRINSGGYGYDAAGNLTSTYNGIFTLTYSFDAANQLVNFNNGTATYTFDAEGRRVRKDANGGWTEYVQFNGLPIAEKNSDGTWSDYIFANGQRIARADTYDARIHVHGTTPGGAIASWQIGAGAGYVIKPNDKLYLRQFQVNANGGPNVQFTDNTQTYGLASDNSGQPISAAQTQDQWVNRIIDLSAFAGKIVNDYQVVTDGTTPAGTYDIYYSDIAIVSSDGSVTPVYNRHQGATFPVASINGQTNLSAIEEASNLTGDSVQGYTTTTYYHGDQIGSTRLTTSAGGWPTSSDTFYPFGQEQPGTSGPNHYKFTGLERDTESTLDHAMYRQYASAQGRWMSPDPYSGSMDLANPQSFNRYAYVGNNPLGFTDPSGLQQTCIANCGQPAPPNDPTNNKDNGEWYDPVDWPSMFFGLFSHPSFHGSLHPRPASPITQGPNGVYNMTIYGQTTSSTVQTVPSNITVNISPDVWFWATHGSHSGVAWWSYQFGNWCGAGGRGAPVNDTDAGCMMHDYCYASNNFKLSDNTNAGLSPGRAALLQGCNQSLCTAMMYSDDRYARQHITWFFQQYPRKETACH